MVPPGHTVHTPSPVRFPPPPPGSSRPPPDKAMGHPPVQPTYNLDRELMDLEKTILPSEEFLRGTVKPNLRRLEQLRHMIQNLDCGDQAGGASGSQQSQYPPHPHGAPPPHVPPQHQHHHHQHVRPHLSPSHPVHMERDDGGVPQGHWGYSDRQRHQMEWAGMRPSQHQYPPMPRPQQHPVPGGGNSGPGSGASRNSNNWAVDMERRRILELQQMQKEKDAYVPGSHAGMSYSGSAPLHSSATSSRPNISLLPTSVVRQMHNTKSSHQVR